MVWQGAVKAGGGHIGWEKQAVFVIEAGASVAVGVGCGGGAF